MFNRKSIPRKDRSPVRNKEQTKSEKIALALLTAGVSKENSPALIAALSETSLKSAKLQSTDAWNVANRLYEKLGPTSVYYCQHCQHVLPNQLSVCSNRECHNTAKFSSQERMWLGTYSLKEQLMPVIKNNFDKILNCHQNNHDIAGDKIMEDLSGCLRYRQNMESKAEFDNGTLCLPVSIGYDGFVPKGQSKKEITPIYVRVEALGEKENRTIRNVAVAAVLVAKKGLTNENSNIAASRLHAEIISSQLSPWKISIGPKTWAIKLVPAFLFADLKGIRNVAGMPNWQSMRPCVRCNVTGTLFNKTFKFYDDIENIRNLSLIEQKELLDVPERWNLLTTLAPPWLRTFDELHVWSEGVAKNIWRDLFDSTSKWPELKMKRKDFEELNTSLENIRGYTYSRCQVTCLRQRPLCSGSEIRELFRIILPTIACCGIHEPKIRLFLLYLYSFVYGLLDCNSEDVPRLRALSTALHNLHGSLNKETYTFKAHDLYLHSLECLLEMGKIRNQSCAEFERYHSDLHRFSIKGSKTPVNIVKRFLMHKNLKSRVPEPIEEPETNRWIPEFIYNEVEIPTDSSIPTNLVRDRYPQLFSELYDKRNARFFSRASVQGKKYCSKMWDRTSTTNGHQGIAVNNGSTHLGDIIIFFETNGKICFVMRPWRCQNPLTSFQAEIESFLEPEEQRLLSDVRANNQCFFEKIGEANNVILLDAKSLTANFLSITFKNRTFAFTCFS